MEDVGPAAALYVVTLTTSRGIVILMNGYILRKKRKAARCNSGSERRGNGYGSA